MLKPRPARDWAKELNRIGVPSGAVLSVPEILEMPQVADRGFLNTFEDVPGVGRDIQVATTGIKLNGAAPAVETPHQLSVNTTRNLAGSGLTPDDIKELKRNRVI